MKKTTTKTKTELLDQIKKNLSAQKQVPFDLDNRDAMETDLQPTTIVGESLAMSTKHKDSYFDENGQEVKVQATVPIKDNVPVYEELSVHEMGLAKIWPPTTLPVRGIIPYLKRMLIKGPISVLVLNDNSGANIRFLMDELKIAVYHSGEKSPLFDVNIADKDNLMDWDNIAGTVTTGLDAVFFANPVVAPKDELKFFYDKLRFGGLFAGCNYNVDSNIDIVKAFRKEVKIGVNVAIAESGAFFWKKEDYTERNVVTPTAVAKAKANPNDSHLKLEYLAKYGTGKIFIETGTYLGQTVELVKALPWNEIHSIELNEEMANAAKEMFKDDDRVKIWQGDSSDILQQIVRNLDEPATFWLDAHASGPIHGGRSGGSPVLDELNIILGGKRKDHTIFIDDKRLFGSGEWSFVKLEDAMKILEKINPGYVLHLLDGEIKDDIICATLK